MAVNSLERRLLLPAKFAGPVIISQCAPLEPTHAVFQGASDSKALEQWCNTVRCIALQIYGYSSGLEVEEVEV